MHLDSCRELKRSLRDRRPQLRARADTPWLGLGITPSAAGEYRLAVRYRDPAALPDDLMREIADAAHDEVDVREVGEIKALTAPPAESAPSPDTLQQRLRPLVPGCSIGHPDITAGTLGAFVTVAGAPHLLSNNHVVGDSGQASIGDPTLQPGVADGGRVADDRVGALAAMAPLHTDRPNLLDAAITRVDDEIETSPERYPGGPITTVVDEVAGAGEVEKIGRTTGHTRGRVTAFEVDGIQVSFPHGVLVFDGQIEVAGSGTSFSAGGDSGSMIWTADSRDGLGLLFAGSDTGGPDGTGLTYANPLHLVLAEFGATLAGAG